VLNIYKPIGWTSFDVVRWVRKRIDNKVGHAGTLDPFAEGVLLICTGKSTKRVPEFMQLEKEYKGCIELGIATDTLDVTGKVVGKSYVPKIDNHTLALAASSFLGEITQVPPMYSAIKIAGKRLYDIARTGEEALRKPRKVRIQAFDILRIELPIVFFRIICSKGTYIRTLAYDFAQKIGTIGFLRSLTRTRIGNFTLKDSYRLYLLEEYFSSLKGKSKRAMNGNNLES